MPTKHERAVIPARRAHREPPHDERHVPALTYIMQTRVDTTTHAAIHELAKVEHRSAASWIRAALKREVAMHRDMAKLPERPRARRADRRSAPEHGRPEQPERQVEQQQRDREEHEGTHHTRPARPSAMSEATASTNSARGNSRPGS